MPVNPDFPMFLMESYEKCNSNYSHLFKTPGKSPQPIENFINIYIETSIGKPNPLTDFKSLACWIGLHQVHIILSIVPLNILNHENIRFTMYSPNLWLFLPNPNRCLKEKTVLIEKALKTSGNHGVPIWKKIILKNYTPKNFKLLN